MFEFEDYENLSDYVFTYPAFEVLQHTYSVALKRKEVSLPACSFQDYIIKHTKFRIKHGYRKYREFEPEYRAFGYVDNRRIRNDYSVIPDMVKYNFVCSDCRFYSNGCYGCVLCSWSSY